MNYTIQSFVKGDWAVELNKENKNEIEWFWVLLETYLDSENLSIGWPGGYDVPDTPLQYLKSAFSGPCHYFDKHSARLNGSARKRCEKCAVPVINVTDFLNKRSEFSLKEDEYFDVLLGE